MTKMRKVTTILTQSHHLLLNTDSCIKKQALYKKKKINITNLSILSLTVIQITIHGRGSRT
uniref:Uncharacterized protein n=1 Tax=Bartonella rochalimae ATCC BAA-1498 TaxID=685782 RepID=E6YM90_9HYPH|nr:hypothetical protein BARRO_50341 [Bartonella rochalimae ATCC BAA-1498]